MKALPTAGLLLVYVTLSACSTASRVELESGLTSPDGRSGVEIADNVVLALPERAELQNSLAATQLLTASYGKQTYRMQIQLELRPGAIALAGLNSFGAVIFTIEYDGLHFNTRGSRTITQRLLPQYVLADVLVTHWDIERLRSRLHGPAIDLFEEGGRRVIARDREPVIVISYDPAGVWEGPVRFEHIERGYVLDIRTVNLEVR